LGDPKLLTKDKPKKEKEQKVISGNWLQYITTGFVFAIASFTDPTFYAVILMGGETGNILAATLLLTIWFAVSQFMAVIVYIANELNLLDSVVIFVDKFKQKNLKAVSHALHILLLIIAAALILDSGYYLLTGIYLF